MGEDEIDDLILCLRQLKEEKSEILSSIADFDFLIETLYELNNLIEMNKIKNSIASQIKFLLINNNKNFDGHMLHTVLSGSPGVGKTEVGIILAKLWSALGIINKTQNKQKTLVVKPISLYPSGELNTPNTPNTSIDSSEENLSNSLEKINKLEKQVQNLSSNGKFKNNVVKKLQSHVRNIKTDLKNINSNAKFNIFQVKSLKREIENNLILTSFEDIIEKYDSIINEIETILSTSIPEENINFTVTMVKKNIKNVEKELGMLIDEIENPKEISKNIEKDFETKKLIKIVSREDFVAGFHGQSALKTEKLLNDSIGKVLFIDEAYSLVNEEKDSYGKEVLTTLNRFMSENSSKIIIIFAGYRDLLESSIFTYQPGLKRRCSWFFDIKGYSEEGLGKIFENQLEKNGWKTSPDLDLKQFFRENMKDFPHFGGDTLRLSFYCKICYSKEVFDFKYPDEKVINEKILNCALKYLRENKIKGNEFDHSENFMYI
jgi:DNA polymerase III delta prime subunit